MPYDEELAERVRRALTGVPKVDERKMFGGLCFMVDGKMALGITHEDLMVRLDPELYGESLQRKGAREMDFTGRPMKGFVFVGKEGYAKQTDLDHWIARALEFNKKAKPSKKKS